MFSTGFTFTQCLTSFSSIDHLFCLCAQVLILFHLTQVRFSQSNHLLFLSLMPIIRTGFPILGELINLVNSVIIFLSQMVNFPNHIPDCDSSSPALLNFFLYSVASICSTITSPPMGKSDHVVVSVSIDFWSNSQQDAPFHHIAYDYSCAYWDGLCDHLRDVPWDDIFELSASAAAS